jgi:RNA polymerase-binding transcription factor DksA
MAEITRLQNEAARGDELAGKRGDPALEVNPWERVLTLSIIANKLSLVHEIDQALGRMATHTYGYCVDTDEPISLNRLREIPWARCR